MICNNYICDFWKTVFYLALSAVQLHMGMWTMIICQNCSQLGKNGNNFAFDERKKKSNIFKKKQEVFGSDKVVLLHTFCVLEFLTLSNNNWTSSSIQIKFISGHSFNFTFLFEDIFYQMCLKSVFLCRYKIFDKI